jgi:hypothetical protein
VRDRPKLKNRFLIEAFWNPPSGYERPNLGFSFSVPLFSTARRRDVVKDKRAARIAYYEGIRRAALEQFKTTEEGLRKLEGLKPGQTEKLIADVHKRHEKILKRIDQYIKDDRD